jgi:hypothetical protein
LSLLFEQAAAPMINKLRVRVCLQLVLRPPLRLSKSIMFALLLFACSLAWYARLRKNMPIRDEYLGKKYFFAHFCFIFARLSALPIVLYGSPRACLSNRKGDVALASNQKWLYP